MKEKKQKLYNPAIDMLRIISIVAVVLIHTTTRTLEASSLDLLHFPWTLFLNQISRFAVPLFFMISGFVLELNYSFHSHYGSYLQKRLNRILIPYVFWSILYYFFVYKLHTINLFQTLLTGSASYQLYFIPTLLIFYLLFPLLHSYYRYIKNLWVLMFLGLIQFVLLGYVYYINPLPFYYPISIGLLNFFPFILGIVASHHQPQILQFFKKQKVILIAIPLVLGFSVFLEGRERYLETNNYLSFYSQWRPSIFLYTTSLGMLFYCIFSQKSFSVSFIKILAKLSFFVFFIHVIILEVFWYMFGNTLFHHMSTYVGEKFWFDPFFFLSVTGISLLIAYLVHKIPFLAKITG